MLDVAKIKAYGQAGLNAAQTILTFLNMYPNLNRFTTPMNSAVKILNDTLTTFSDITGDQLTISYDNTNIRTAVDSILIAIEQIALLIKNITTMLSTESVVIPTTVSTRIQLVYDALVTVISVFKAVLLTSRTVGIAPPTMLSSKPTPQLVMNESSALKILNV